MAEERRSDCKRGALFGEEPILQELYGFPGTDRSQQENSRDSAIHSYDMVDERFAAGFSSQQKR